MVQADGQNNGRYKSLTLDVERYQAMLDAPDLSDAQRRELIETLWQVVVGFIDLNVEIRTTDEGVGESCGKLPKLSPSATCDAPPVVKSSIPLMKSGFAEASSNAANAPVELTTKQEAS
ncbi:hypothetical protein [Pseudoprimorskyibacter insulae]|uniref:Uncharacterized protein n=1 Tax=Pseudoprimorskyibacter insulae TaxID=1695997 RepID=A0A2R8AXB7_9RHOB|nr:hypothetical protein [Pseudoprimorskyibacter insulae]SPF80663.1 hypothetical protein PRI8871_02473 [Pseudoprimorskyibacter insulae]